MKREPIAIIAAVVVIAEALAAVAGLPVWVYPALACLAVVGRQFVTPFERPNDDTGEIPVLPQ